MNSQIVKLETSLVNMKWAAIILCLFMALPCWAFPVHTNYSVLRPFDAEGPEFNQFFWSWSGFDDQQIVADVADITFSNASFRVTYPARGDIYLDVATTNFITTFRTSVVSIVNEVFTTCYIKITYTNIFYATTNKTITESRYVDFYTNQTVSPVTLTALVASTTASNQIGTNSASSCVISTGTAPTTALAAYGLYTNTWFGGTNLTTWTTNTIFLQVYSSNYVADGQFVNANSATTLWSFVGATAINQRAQNIQMVTNCTAYLPVTTPSVEVGKTYRIYFLFTKSADSAYTGIGTSIVCGVTNTHTASGYNVITNTATVADGFTFKWGATNATGYTYIDDVVIQEYVSGRTNAAVGATTNTLVHSNLVVETYPATTHTNTLYTLESNDYQRVVITFSRTNLPPDGPYFGEILAYGGATTETRSVGKGQISVDHSLYANTNGSGWTNPTAAAMIGPPSHTLTTLSGWPFPSSIIITNGSSTTGHIADGVLDISISQTVSSSETQTLVSVLQIGNSAGTNNINMNGQSITNIATNSLAFSDGQTITSTKVQSWDQKMDRSGATTTVLRLTSYTNTGSARVMGQMLLDGPTIISNTLDVMTGFSVYGTTMTLYDVPPNETTIFEQNGFDLWIRLTGEVYKNNTSVFWHIDNDGSGSGLDADLLDGITSTSFVRKVAINGVTSAPAGGVGLIDLGTIASGSGATQAISTVGSSTVTSTITGATLSWSNAAAGGGGGGGAYAVQGTNNIAPTNHANTFGLADIGQTIGGGVSHIVTNANYSTVGGGQANTIAAGATHGTVGGGNGNDIGASATYSTVGGGQNNDIPASATHAVIAGGKDNAVAASYDFVGGGLANLISAAQGYNVICGGGYSSATYANIISARRCNAIVGGLNNIISGGGVDGSFISGGSGSRIHQATYSAILGSGNIASNTVDQGQGNLTVVGAANTITNASQSAAFGNFNDVSGTNAMALGTRGKSQDNGTIVISAGSDTNAFFVSGGSDRLAIRAPGGVWVAPTYSTTAIRQPMYLGAYTNANTTTIKPTMQMDWYYDAGSNYILRTTDGTTNGWAHLQ